MNLVWNALKTWIFEQHFYFYNKRLTRAHGALDWQWMGIWLKALHAKRSLVQTWVFTTQIKTKNKNKNGLPIQFVTSCCCEKHSAKSEKFSLHISLQILAQDQSTYGTHNHSLSSSYLYFRRCIVDLKRWSSHLFFPFCFKKSYSVYWKFLLSYNFC